MHDNKLSLPMAILININIMMGSGIFLNTVLIANKAGSVGFLSYALVGLMLLPLVLTMAKLIEMYPMGGFYSFTRQELSTFAGFITTWGYFTAKLASATIMIHTCAVTLQQLIPPLASISPYLFDLVLLTIFLALNMLHIRTGGTIQAMFTTFKSIPILFVIFAGLFFISGANLTSGHQLWSGIPLILPITIYAVMGFESACSISSKIRDAHKNAPLVILISYAINMAILMSYQFIFYGALGTELATSPTYRDMFPAFLSHMVTDPAVLAKLGALFNIAIASSILGGAYGIIFSNAWNVYTLANHNHLPFSKFLTRFNRYQIPFLCILLEGVICLCYLLVSYGPNTQVVLQSIGALGVVFTYTMSAIALINAKRKNPAITIPSWIPQLGLVNCIILVGICINRLIQTGVTGLYGFLALFALGSILYWWQTYRQQTTRPTAL